MNEIVLPQSLANNRRLDRWIGFEPGGRVRLSVGKVESAVATSSLAQAEGILAPRAFISLSNSRWRLSPNKPNITPPSLWPAL